MRAEALLGLAGFRGDFPMKIYDVFISYRRHEADGREQGSNIAKAIYDYLTSKDLRVFLDKERMENGPFPEQLEWQVTHAPNYIFIATEAAMHFRDVVPPDTDYVAEELKLALKLYPENPGDRTILPIIPQDIKVPADSDTTYPEEVHALFKHNAPAQLDGEIPSQENLKEILKKVTCVNRGNLWNAGYRWYENSRTEGNRFASLNIDRTIMPQAGLSDGDVRFPIRAGLENREDKPLMDQIRDTKGHLYLIGEGGIGKTTALFSIMEEVYGAVKSENDIERFRLSGQVPLFIELSRAPDTYGRLYEGGISTFIKRAVYMQMRTDLKAKQISSAAVEQVQDVFDMDPETAVNPIRDIFSDAIGAPEYILLLDGLNEVSRTEIGYKYKDGDGTEYTGKSSVISMILGEIRDLMANSPNVRIILTSRSREECNWRDRATLLYLSGIKPEMIEPYLRERKVSEKRIDAALHNAVLEDILQIPLFLTMYASLAGEDEILSRGEILRLFFHQKKEDIYTAKERILMVEDDTSGAASAKQPVRLTADMQSYIIDFILPAIAWRMVKAGEFYIQRDFLGQDGEGLDEIIESVLTDDGNTSVNGSFGSSVYREYSSGSDAGLNTADTAERLKERFGNRIDKVRSGVLNCAVMTLGILRSDGVNFAFIHQHVRDYFAAIYQINRLRMAVYLHGHNRNELALTCLEDWKNEPLPYIVRQFIGESLGECHNKPWCDDEGNWHYNVPEKTCDRSLLHRILSVYRGMITFVNDRHTIRNVLKARLLHRRNYLKNNSENQGYDLWNIIQILKEVRVDLSGEDFSQLDLTGIRLNGCSLRHVGCVALFKGAKLDINLFYPLGHNTNVVSSVYSPDGSRIITLSTDGDAIMWDANTAQVIASVTRNNCLAKSILFSPRGDIFAIITKEDRLYIQNINGLNGAYFHDDTSIRVDHMDFSPRGNLLAEIHGETVSIWDVNRKNCYDRILLKIMERIHSCSVQVEPCC